MLISLECCISSYIDSAYSEHTKASGHAASNRDSVVSVAPHFSLCCRQPRGHLSCNACHA
jgi:hypothetical protein